MSQVITYETLFDILRKESSKDDLQKLSQDFYDEVQSYLKEKKDSPNSGYRSKIEYENSKKILRELYDRRERKILLLALNKARTQSAIIDPSILLSQEKKLFDSLVQLLETTKRESLADIIGLTSNNYLAAQEYTNKKEYKKLNPDKKPSTQVQAEAPTMDTVPQTQAPLESTEPTNPEQTMQETAISAPAKHEKNPTPTGYTKVKFLHAVPKFIGKDMTIFGPYDPGAETELPEEIVQVLLKKGRIEEI